MPIPGTLGSLSVCKSVLKRLTKRDEKTNLDAVKSKTRLEMRVPDVLSEPHLAEVGNASFPPGMALPPPPLPFPL